MLPYAHELRRFAAYLQQTLRLERGERVRRVLTLSTGAVRLEPSGAADELELTDTTLTTHHGPSWRLLLIGAGQMTQYLAQMAQALGYQVTVCDPREEYGRYGNPTVRAFEEKLAMLEHPDGAQVMFFERDGGWETGPFERPLGRGIVIQVFVNDVDAVAKRVEAAGLSYFVAPFEKWRDWGDRLGGQREFLILDPDGYLVKVAQLLGERPK